MEVEELLANSVVGGTLPLVEVQLLCTSTLSTPQVTHKNVERRTPRGGGGRRVTPARHTIVGQKCPFSSLLVVG